jgi:UDP-glucose 4-epimerase
VERRQSVDDFNDKTILVVGGAGFVGSNLVKALLKRLPREIRVVDNLLSSERINVPESENINFIEGSITNDQILMGLQDNIDYVFHLATYHGNQSSIHDPLADHENNTLTTLKLYERIRSFKRIKKVVYSSAGCTIAEKTFDQASETAEDAPVSLFLDSPYQISKIIGEFYSNYYFKQYHLPVVKARFQNVYGPGEILGAGKWRGTPATVWRNVIPTFIYRGIRKMPLILENGGIATRDFIYIDDIVHGLMLCAAEGHAGEVYNLASGQETQVLELGHLINRLSHNPCPIEFVPRRTWDHSGKRFGSTRKARAGIGFEARVELKEGLIQTLDWTDKNLPLIESCIQRHARYMKG